MDIKNAPGPYFWDCQYWSDFHEESECLFLGGLFPFQIQSIRHIPSRTNYRRYIIPMNMLSRMLVGYHSHTRMAIDRDLRMLKELIGVHQAWTRARFRIHHWLIVIPGLAGSLNLRRRATRNQGPVRRPASVSVPMKGKRGANQSRSRNGRALMRRTCFAPATAIYWQPAGPMFRNG